MYIPVISPFSKSMRKLYRRKGGGGGGRSGGGGGSSGGGGRSGGGTTGSSSGGTRGGSSGGGTSSSGAQRSVPISSSSNVNTGGRNSATAYGAGGGRSTKIPSGQLFSGRTVGGGTRSEVFGTRTYGSGYPGFANQRGVANLGFPFYFWPVVWGTTVGITARDAYLHDSEYGQPNNSSRPGGVLETARFASNSKNSTFHIIADNSTTSSLVSSILNNCTSFYTTNASSLFTPMPYNASAPGAPLPEQAIQYYRASSVVLTLDGYNNTAALSNNSELADTPLPPGVDMNLLNCMNQTIGAAVPLIDRTSKLIDHSCLHVFVLVALVYARNDLVIIA